MGPRATPLISERFDGEPGRPSSAPLSFFFGCVFCFRLFAPPCGLASLEARDAADGAFAALPFAFLFCAVALASCLSRWANASASHAFFRPRTAGRLLFHSADPASPAICPSERLVSTE